MRGILLTTAVALAAAEACTTDVTGTGMRSDQLSVRSDASASASRTVPFKAHYVASIIGVGPGPGCDARLSLEGAGTGTYLGNFTIALGFCGRADGTLDTGTGTFVAANGDLLNITFNGVSDGGYPTLHFTSYITFTGGTGRFEGATGTATVQGSFDDLTGVGPADWNGELTFANGQR